MFKDLLVEIRASLDETLTKSKSAPKDMQQNAYYAKSGESTIKAARAKLRNSQLPDKLAARQKHNETNLATMRKTGRKLIGGKSPFAANLIRRK